jgi:tryptophan-rich sensory protein
MDRRPSAARQALGLLAWLAIAFAAAGVGAIASVQAASLYADLAKPAWAPPPAIFGPVWTVLYALMGVAAWLVWREPPGPRRSRALLLFLVQLPVNALWSWFFFAWRLGGAAFVDVLLLLALVAATAAAFWRVRALPGVLMLPYLAWVAFASVLTWAVWQANPSLLGAHVLVTG